VACNLVHDLGTHEHQSLVSLDGEASPLVGETTGAASAGDGAKSANEIAADEISALARDVRNKLPVIKIAKEKKNTGASRAWASDALGFVNRLVKLHENLLERNLQLRADLMAPDLGENPVKYGKVSGMKLTQKSGKPIQDIRNTDSCELKCSMDQKCKSYSYNPDEYKCVLSSTSLGYSPDSVFYAKAESTEGEAMKYRMFPGLFEASRNKNPLQGISQVACQLACTRQGHLCQGFSYRASRQACTFTQDPLEYDKYWDYYEKPPRTFALGNPIDGKADEEWDLLKRETEHFWKRFTYERALNDKKKITKLKNQVDAVMDKANSLETKLRAVQSQHSRTSVEAELLGRQSKQMENALRTASKQMMAAKGVVKERDIAITLANQKIENRKKEILDEDPEFHEKGLSMGDDELIRQYGDELIAARKKKAAAEEAEMNTQMEYDDAQGAIDDVDERQIAALVKTKNLAQTMKSSKVEMRNLARKALDMQKVMDKLDELVSPPSATMAPPSGHSALSWDAKADEGTAAAKLFYMTPAEKRAAMMRAKKLDAKKEGDATKDEKPEPEAKSGSA